MIGKMAIRYVTRRKLRLALTVIAIAITSSLYVSLDIFGRGSIFVVVDAYTRYLGDFDIIVTSSSPSLGYFNASNVTKTIDSLGYDLVSVDRLILFGAVPVNDTYRPLFAVGINSTLDNHIGSFETVQVVWIWNMVSVWF